MSENGHLGRLEQVFLESPIVYITSCSHDRRDNLACDQIHAICKEVWHKAEQLYGWIVGRYVIMPDHVHFFCTPIRDGVSLSAFIGKWKEWTSKYAVRRHRFAPPLWQSELFDHVLRKSESYENKWHYVVQNPIRAGLVEKVEDWPYQGELHRLEM